MIIYLLAYPCILKKKIGDKSKLNRDTRLGCLVSCLPEGLNGLAESSLGAAGCSLVAATTRRLFLAGRSGKETAAARREGETRRADTKAKSTEAFTYTCLSESP